MNTQKKIEQCLRAAPKPQVPDGLLEKLQMDLSARDIKTHRSLLRRWLAPTGGPISLWRAAAIVIIVVAVLLPLTYGTSKIVKVCVFNTESRQANKDGSVTVTKTSVKLAGDFADEEETRKVWEQTRELKRTGKYERKLLKETEENGVKFRIYEYIYTLSDGKVIGFAESEQVDEE